MLIATRKTAWRKADKPDDDKLTVLAKVNRGELSQRQAGEILGVSYTWVRDLTKRYFGRDGQRIAARTADPDPNRNELPMKSTLGAAIWAKPPRASTTPARSAAACFMSG